MYTYTTCVYIHIYTSTKKYILHKRKTKITKIEYVFICMYVCMYVCMYIYIYIYKHTHTHTHTHTHIYAYYIHTYIYTYIHTHTHAYIYIHACMHTHAHTHIQTYKHTNTYMHACLHTHIHTLSQVCKYRYLPGLFAQSSTGPTGDEPGDGLSELQQKISKVSALVHLLCKATPSPAALTF
jgi:hypothetical protein